MLNIIYEDEQVVVIDKPAGVATMPRSSLPSKGGSGRVEDSRRESVSEILKTKWPESEPAHRLDNDTSGLLIIAKNKASFEKLRSLFEKRKIVKKYTALVLGELPENGEINSPIIHDPKNQKKMKVADEGQAAHTSFKLLEKIKTGLYSLAEVEIKTGVRHQIRVHLASIGHPLAGDRLYQNVRQRTRDKTGLARHFLHASYLKFEDKEFFSGLPEELRNILTKLNTMR